MSGMKLEFSSFRNHYKELSEFVEPRRGRFFVEDRNKGDKRYKNIINNKASLALRDATAGMMAGVISPSRPWYAYDMFNKEILEDPQVKAWLHLLRTVVLAVFAQSNFYNMAPTKIKELLLFGTGCMTHVDDFEDVARFKTLTTGSYTIAQNDRDVIDTLGREYQMTANQMVSKFGKNNVSVAVLNNYDNGNYGAWHTVRHFVEPNPFRDKKLSTVSSQFANFRSVYWEPSVKHATDKNKFLKSTGYSVFPAYVSRWELTGEDIYATSCPGMMLLGDVKQLQSQEVEKGKAIAKANTPPLQGPASLKNQPIMNLPGGVTTYTSTTQKIEPLYKTDPRIQEMLFDIQATERRIETCFFVDLFKAITNMEGIQPKNQLQLSQINEERLLLLGPVLEQIHGEWLSKMVNRTTIQVLEAGIMPEAPPKLQGMELDIQFISSLAMAQKAVATSAIERTVGFAGSLTAQGWDGGNKINTDYAIDEYASLIGAPPKMIVPTDEANARRQEQAKAAQQQEQMAMASQAANVAKMASDAKLGDDSVLKRATGG
jgi:hypothetical protein